MSGAREKSKTSFTQKDAVKERVQKRDTQSKEAHPAGAKPLQQAVSRQEPTGSTGGTEKNKDKGKKIENQSSEKGFARQKWRGKEERTVIAPRRLPLVSRRTSTGGSSKGTSRPQNQGRLTAEDCWDDSDQEEDCEEEEDVEEKSQGEGNGTIS